MTRPKLNDRTDLGNSTRSLIINYATNAANERVTDKHNNQKYPSLALAHVGPDMGRFVPECLRHTVFLLRPVPVGLAPASLVVRPVSGGLVLAQLMRRPALVLLEPAELVLRLVLRGLRPAQLMLRLAAVSVRHGPGQCESGGHHVTRSHLLVIILH